MRFPAVLLPLVLSWSCAADDPEDLDVGGGGKADDIDPTLAALAREHAEQFDFAGESDTRVPRDQASTAGPTWVDRAYALYWSWEENDLGSVRLFRWTIDGRRVWAMWTSTDGDDTFIELFDAEGDWLATGTGGFELNPDKPDEFRPVIFWDSVLGTVRDGPAAKDFSEDVVAFWREIDAIPSGTSLGVTSARRLVETMFAGPMTTHALEGWEERALWRALADRSVPWTSSARSFAGQLGNFYFSHFAVLGTVTTPSVTTTLGLPAALASRIRLARATITGSYLDTGVSEFSSLLTKLDRFPSSSTITTRAHLEAALRSAGCTSAEAVAAIHALGADDTAARIAVASLHTISPEFVPVVQPGAAWFVATPAKTFVSALTVVDDGESVAGWQALADQSVADATGVARTSTLIQVRKRADRTWFDLSYQRPDGGILDVVVELPRSTSEDARLHLRSHSPSLDPELAGSLATAIAEDVGGEVDALGFTATTGDAWAVVYRKSSASGAAKLAIVDFSPPGVADAQPSSLTDERREALALATARHHAEQMVVGLDPAAHVEVLLRTAWATTADLVPTVDPADSAVGFDTTTDHSQYMLPSVWGDNAVYVTFGKTGTVRVESFN